MKLEIKMTIDVDPVEEEGFHYCLDKVEVSGFSEAVKDLTCWDIPDVVWTAKNLLDDLVDSADEAGKVAEVEPTREDLPPLVGYLADQLIEDTLKWSRVAAIDEQSREGLVLAYMQGCLNIREPRAAEGLLELRGMRKGEPR